MDDTAEIITWRVSQFSNDRVDFRLVSFNAEGRHCSWFVRLSDSRRWGRERFASGDRGGRIGASETRACTDLSEG